MLLKQLVENLGNLKDLNVGPMIDVLKQAVHTSRRSKESEASQMGVRFGGDTDSKRRYNITQIGSGSDVVDGGVVKKGLTDVRKAYRQHEDVGALAFALYVDGKAVAFGKFDQETLAGASRSGLMAFDLNVFEPEIIRRFEAKKAAETSDYMRRQMKPRDISSSVVDKKEKYKWDRKDPEVPEFETKMYRGKAMTTGELKDFVDEIVDLAHAQGSTVTMKLVLTDKKAQKKRQDRYANKSGDPEMFTGVEALKKRLAKFKLSKKPTARDIHEFMRMVGGGIKVVQFAGRAYKTQMESYNDVKPQHLLSGKPFEVRYRSVDPDSMDSVDVTYSFDPETGTLVPFKADYVDRTVDDNKYTNKEVTLEPKRHMRHELDVATLDKDSIVRSILQKVKDNHLAKARNMINVARQGGHDYPEFKAIERSIDAEEQKKKQQAA